MGISELLLIAAGLSMDAFAVAVSDAMSSRQSRISKEAFAIGICFGLFQGAMPTIGFFLGKSFEKYITAFDHYIALILLGFIGVKMIFEAFKAEQSVPELSSAVILVQGVATSIDALAVGISFAALQSVNIVFAAAAICITTFFISFCGVFIGGKFGSRFSGKAQILGGFILIATGIKIFIEHMFF